MKKMWYTLLFIIILALLVFAGCKMFSNGGSDESEPDEGTVSESVETTSENASENTSEPVSEEAGSEVEPTSDVSAPVTEPLQPVENDTSADDQTSAAATEPEDPSVPASDPSSPTESTSAPPAAASSAQYDVMRSGAFYMKGVMNDGAEQNGVILAVSDTILYMESSMDGVSLGLLQSGDTTYLLAPKSKTYCEFGSVLSSILQEAGMMSKEELREMVDKMGFKEMKPLSEAKEVLDATVNGVACKAYVYDKEDGGTSRICISGDRLVAIEKYNADGTFDSATYIDEISAAIPTLPPTDYKKVNIFTFMTSVQGDLG